VDADTHCNRNCQPLNFWHEPCARNIQHCIHHRNDHLTQLNDRAANVEVGGEDDCWPWKGALNKDGKGQLVPRRLEG
jgi:hypothetical protein